MKTRKSPLYIIDAYALIFRSYFAFLSRPLRNAKGENVSALFGFFRYLLSILNDGAKDGSGLPGHMAIAFDSIGPTFRHVEYPEYKAKRAKTPEDLHAQVPLIREALTALGIQQIRSDGYEADDIIASLVRLCKAEGRPAYICSSDKDLLQLIDENTFMLRPARGAGQTGGQERIGVEEVKAEWGVKPSQILDILSLTGDSSDNVPGVRGIGDKGAISLITRFGNLDAVYENIAGIEGAIGKKLAEGRESAFFSRKLIRLVDDLALPSENIEDYSLAQLDRQALATILRREGAHQLAKDFVAQAPDANSAAPDVNSVAPGVNSAEPELAPSAQKYSSLHNLADLEKLLQRAQDRGKMALDFECAGLNPHTARVLGMSISIQAGEAFYVPFCQHASEDGELFSSTGHIDLKEAGRLLNRVLQNPNIRIAAHNARFDYILSRYMGLDPWKAKILDSMIAAWILESERASIGLDNLSADLLGLHGLAFKDIVPKDKTFADLPLSLATQYACEDADFTFQLMHELEDRLKAQNKTKLFYDLEMPLVPVLAEMEIAGIKIDTHQLKTYSLELEIKLAAVEQEVFQLVGREFNIASPKQLQEVLFTERKLKPGKKTKTGYSTNVAVLEELAREDPVPELILRHRSLAKLKNTYVDSLPQLVDANSRIHTTLVQTGTATGRLSSRDPNLQNIPIRQEEGRRIRGAFIAEQGKLLLSADYSQIELVVLAHFSGDPALLEAFASGQDVHRHTARLIFGGRDEEVSAEQRRIAKTINFGVMYGMSAFRLANELGIGRSEAQDFIDRYFATYSSVRSFMEELVEHSLEDGYIETLFGHRRAIPSIYSSNKTEQAQAKRIAINTPIQGSAADIVKKAMLDIDAALKDRPDLAGTKMLLQVHDELIFETPEERVGELAALVQEKMEGAVELSVPLRTSIEWGSSWGSIH